MSYNNIYNFYTTMRTLKSNFGYDEFEQNEWIPFEREIKLSLIINEQKEESEKNKNGA